MVMFRVLVGSGTAQFHRTPRTLSKARAWALVPLVQPAGTLRKGLWFNPSRNETSLHPTKTGDLDC